MSRTTIGIVLNGVTGRMGLRQHLIRSVLAIREAGGLPLAEDVYRAQGIDVVRTDRGGKLTYHGPGGWKPSVKRRNFDTIY